MNCTRESFYRYTTYLLNSSRLQKIDFVFISVHVLQGIICNLNQMDDTIRKWLKYQIKYGPQSGWNTGLSAELLHLYAQFTFDQEIRTHSNSINTGFT